MARADRDGRDAGLERVGHRGLPLGERKPILANDPHLDFAIPSTWYLVHLHAPGLDVAGASLPGIPGVIAGHNDRIAWGVTNLGYDVQDLYREQFDPRTGRYLFRGQLEQARADRDVIAIKGAKPEEIATWVTRHGPSFTPKAAAITR